MTVIDVARGENRVLTTDSSGLYAAPNLTPGIYTVRAEFMGFETVDRQNVEVGVGSDNRVDITLQPGAQTQTVTVTEALADGQHHKRADGRDAGQSAALSVADQWPATTDGRRVLFQE